MPHLSIHRSNLFASCDFLFKFDAKLFVFLAHLETGDNSEFSNVCSQTILDKD